MELKHYIFFLGAGCSLLLATWVVASRWMARLVFALFLLSFLYIIDVNFVSHEWYRGSTRGFEFSVTDLLLGVLVLSLFIQRKLLGQDNRSIDWVPKGSLPVLLFITVAALSLTGADHPLYGLFELSKMVKGYLIFWVVANTVKSPGLVRLVFVTLCLTAGVEIAYGALEHFSRIYRIRGTLPHPNSLAMLMNMMVPLFLADALRRGGRQALMLFPLIAGAVTVVILTFSRGGWIGLAVSMGVVIAVCLWQTPSPRLVGILVLGALALSPVVVRKFPHIVTRWKDAPAEALYSRLKLNEGAYLMMAQSPLLGVGINNSAAWLQQKEKDVGGDPFQRITGRSRFNLVLGSLQLSAERLEQEIEALTYVEGGTLIHNIYLITAAETGLLGLGAFVLIGLRFGWIAVSATRARHPGLVGSVAVGILGGFLATYVQGLAEWEIRQTHLFYLFWTLMGLLVAIDRMPVVEEQKTAAVLVRGKGVWFTSPSSCAHITTPG